MHLSKLSVDEFVKDSVKIKKQADLDEVTQKWISKRWAKQTFLG